MSRGNSSGGGQSSLGYLFGGGPEPAAQPAPAAPKPDVASAPPLAKVLHAEPAAQPAPAAPKPDVESAPPLAKVPDVPAGVLGRNFNNYKRADGQNAGNFITDRPSTKIHSAPGGGSSLNYLFGGGGN